MKTKAIEHVVISRQIGPCKMGHGFLCLRCNGEAHIPHDQPLHLLQKHAAAFTLMHEDCKVPSPQLPLPKHERGDLEPVDAPSTFSKTSGALRGQNLILERLDREARHGGTNGWPMSPATTWIDLWADLEEALEPHEYAALRDWTAFPEAMPLGSHEWNETAAWAWMESHTVSGVLRPRPRHLRDFIYSAVKHAQETQESAKLPEEERPKTREHKRPMLHIHHSNDTMPSKPRVGTAHVIVSTADQADAIRGTLCSSVRFHAGDWDLPLLAYLAGILEPMGVTVNAEKLSADQRSSLGNQEGA